jgi:hypothetical protein
MKLTLKAKIARSYSGQDVPEYFYVVIDTWLQHGRDWQPKCDEVLAQLKARQLDGIRGISSSESIVGQFGSRGAFLQMPGWETTTINNLSRVMYDNPAYLVSKDLLALYRIYDDKYGSSQARHHVLHNVANEVMKAMDSFNSRAYYDLKYVEAGQHVAFWARSHPEKSNTVKQLADFIYRGFLDAWMEPNRGHANVPFTLIDVEEATLKALTKIGRIYNDEGEWFVKDHSLKIPEGTILWIHEEPPKMQKALDWWEDFIAKHGMDTAERMIGYKEYEDILRYRANVNNLMQLGYPIKRYDWENFTKH